MLKRFDNRGSQDQAVDPKTGIQAFQFLCQQPHQRRDGPDRTTGADGDLLHRAIGAAGGQGQASAAHRLFL